jgi:hypothetical protein
MSALLPPVYCDCCRLLVHTEDMVRRFSRYHKYMVGTDLRQSHRTRWREITHRHTCPHQIQTQ